MTNQDICNILREIGELLELTGENPFKYRTYFNAVDTIMTLDVPVQTLVKNGTLASLPGFGKALTTKVTELVETGRLEYYERLKQSVPAGLCNIAALPGMDRRKAGLIYLKLGVSSIEDLSQACLDGRVTTVRGFHQDDQERLIQAIRDGKNNHAVGTHG